MRMPTERTVQPLRRPNVTRRSQVSPGLSKGLRSPFQHLDAQAWEPQSEGTGRLNIKRMVHLSLASDVDTSSQPSSPRWFSLSVRTAGSAFNLMKGPDLCLKSSVVYSHFIDPSLFVVRWRSRSKGSRSTSPRHAETHRGLG